MSTIDTIADGGRAECRGAVRRLGAAIRRLAVRTGDCARRRRSRLDLLELNDHQLKDIGISRCDAHREAMRPLWD